MKTDYSPQLERLARVFNDTTTPPKILPTKPDDPQQVLSLPPHNLQTFYEQTDPQEIVSQRVEQIGKPNLTKENTNPKPQRLLTKQQTDNIHQQELSQLPRVVVERVEQEQPIKRGRGRPKGVKNKPKSEKVSHSPLVRATNNGSEKVSREMKKVSQAPTEFLPVNISFSSQNSGKGKTSLCYALIYAAELTPIQIETLLQNQLELNLTSAEVIALSLIDRTTKGDQKAEKIYWDLMKNNQKNQKPTSEKAEKTLLDEALAKAENAIFGEIVDNSGELE